MENSTQPGLSQVKASMIEWRRLRTGFGEAERSGAYSFTDWILASFLRDSVIRGCQSIFSWNVLLQCYRSCGISDDSQSEGHHAETSSLTFGNLADRRPTKQTNR
ncbi:uncharacterized protein LOC128886442 [Hylaeus anthracinus]|uniref:uncharacterized protein LOC128886442 n=1 Tax=Hylaeus anthracinus TaxID=313031 RepID=UPI0023B99E4D|nr:uncharacterized protein LOC128886442 [Hylaeus anthracinus]